VSYYFDYGDTRFIGITSDQETGESMRISEAGLVWLERVLQESSGFEHIFVFTHHPVSFSEENSLGGTGGRFWQLLVTYDVRSVFSGHWHRYQPSRLGAGGDTWETIIGTGGGWTGFEPIREYQQRHGFLVVEVSGAEVTASFYGDDDDDGFFDDRLDQYTISSADPEPTGLVARYGFEDGWIEDSAPAPLGRGLAGRLENGAQLNGSGISGDALWVDGADDYAVAGAIDDYVLSLNGDLTISLWAVFDEISHVEWANSLLCYGTADYYSEDEESNYSYWLNVESDLSLRAYWEHGNGTDVSVFSTEPAPLSAGLWHHLAFTRDSDAMEVRFYVDGSMVGESVAFDQLPTGGGRGMLYFGSDVEDFLGYGYELNGKLD
jgi:hypothetical protein